MMARIDINDPPAARRAAHHADIRAWLVPPPAADEASIGRRTIKAMRDNWSLVLWLERKHRDPCGSVGQRSLGQRGRVECRQGSLLKRYHVFHLKNTCRSSPAKVRGDADSDKNARKVHLIRPLPPLWNGATTGESVWRRWRRCVCYLATSGAAGLPVHERRRTAIPRWYFARCGHSHPGRRRQETVRPATR